MSSSLPARHSLHVPRSDEVGKNQECVPFFPKGPCAILRNGSGLDPQDKGLRFQDGVSFGSSYLAELPFAAQDGGVELRQK